MRIELGVAVELHLAAAEYEGLRMEGGGGGSVRRPRTCSECVNHLSDAGEARGGGGGGGGGAQGWWGGVGLIREGGGEKMEVQKKGERAAQGGVLWLVWRKAAGKWKGR